VIAPADKRRYGAIGQSSLAGNRNSQTLCFYVNATNSATLRDSRALAAADLSAKARNSIRSGKRETGERLLPMYVLFKREREREREERRKEEKI